MKEKFDYDPLTLFVVIGVIVGALGVSVLFAGCLLLAVLVAHLLNKHKEAVFPLNKSPGTSSQQNTAYARLKYPSVLTPQDEREIRILRHERCRKKLINDLISLSSQPKYDSSEGFTLSTTIEWDLYDFFLYPSQIHADLPQLDPSDFDGLKLWRLTPDALNMLSALGIFKIFDPAAINADRNSIISTIGTDLFFKVYRELVRLERIGYEYQMRPLNRYLVELKDFMGTHHDERVQKLIGNLREFNLHLLGETNLKLLQAIDVQPETDLVSRDSSDINADDTQIKANS